MPKKKKKKKGLVKNQNKQKNSPHGIHSACLSRLVRGPLFSSLFKFVLVANFYFYQLKVGPDFILHPVS